MVAYVKLHPKSVTQKKNVIPVLVAWASIFVLVQPTYGYWNGGVLKWGSHLVTMVTVIHDLDDLGVKRFNLHRFWINLHIVV
jgi:hypothetical protein